MAFCSLHTITRLRPTSAVCIMHRNLFTGAGRENTLQFDYKKMSDEQLYANLNKLRAALPADEFSVVEERVMAPYRKKNRQLGFGLGFFVVMVFGYATYRTKTEDFRNIEPVAK